MKLLKVDTFSINITLKMICSTIVDTVMRLQAGRSGVQIRVRPRDFSHLQNVQTGSGAHTAPYSVRTGIPSQA